MYLELQVVFRLISEHDKAVPGFTFALSASTEEVPFFTIFECPKGI